MDLNNHNPFKIERGQIWEDKDTRRVRKIEVLFVNLEFGYAMTRAIDTRIRHTIRLTRFNRFKCVQAPATLVNA